MAKPQPPGMLRRLVAAIGEDKVLLLLEKRGGTRVYIPAKGLSPEHGLGAELGLDKLACARMNEFADHQLKVPLCRPWRVQLYRWQGNSYTEIALRLHTTTSTVHRVLKEAGATAEQFSLDI